MVHGRSGRQSSQRQDGHTGHTGRGGDERCCSDIARKAARRRAGSTAKSLSRCWLLRHGRRA